MLQGALQFFRYDLFFPAPSPSHLKKKSFEIQQNHKITAMADWTPPSSLPCIAPPPRVTKTEINIASEPTSSPDLPDKAPVANLFGGLHRITQNKRMSISREKFGHTPARKKRSDTAHLYPSRLKLVS